MKLKKAFLDTGVIISYVDRKDIQRRKKAREIVDFLVDFNVVLLYSERTEIELKLDERPKRTKLLKKMDKAAFYIGNENWETIDGHWENIKSRFDVAKNEQNVHNQIEKWLTKRRDLRDRGILLDAAFNECDFFLHENPRDYGKIDANFWREFNIVELDLINKSIEDLIRLINEHQKV